MTTVQLNYHSQVVLMLIGLSQVELLVTNRGMSVSPCRCCMFVSCVHPVAVLIAEFYMTFPLLMLVEDEKGDHMEEACSRFGSHDCLILFTPPGFGECFYYL